MIIFDWVTCHPFFSYIILIPFFMVVFYLMDLYNEQKKNDEEIDTDRCQDIFVNNFWPSFFWLPLLLVMIVTLCVFSPLSKLTIKLAKRRK